MRFCVILGAGGFAREIYWHAKDSASGRFDSFIFVDDVSEKTVLELDGYSWPVEKKWDFQKYISRDDEIGFVVGVGDPKIKIKLVTKALEAGLQPLPTIIHSSALIQDPSCQIGLGGIIAPNCTITTNIVIGNYVTLNLSVSIGHDSRIEDYVNCAPGVAISGNVVLSKAVSLGTGSVIREKTTVAPFVVSGAQACIVKNILDEDITVTGVPAKPLGWHKV